jgi:hypothetical protein
MVLTRNTRHRLTFPPHSANDSKRDLHACKQLLNFSLVDVYTRSGKLGKGGLDPSSMCNNSVALCIALALLRLIRTVMVSCITSHWWPSHTTPFFAVMIEVLHGGLATFNDRHTQTHTDTHRHTHTQTKLT